MAFIRQALLFVVGIAALVAIVPLAVWAGTGNPRTALWALKRHALWLGVVAAAGAAGAVLVLTGAFTP